MNLKIINSSHLKNIALITMIIDHLGCVFFDDKVIFRIIGRASFVLYAFGLVNGINYTSDRSKYLKKLFIWGVISEIPFDLVFNDSLVSFESQNVFFTLFIGALSISLFNQYKSILIKSCILITGLFIGYLGKFDYSWYGVGLIYGMHFLRNLELLKFGFIQGLSTFYAVIAVNLSQFFAFIGILPIYLYNGKQGKKTSNIYYSYYSIHLLIFYIIKAIYY